jgi:hypothetical protein
LRYLARANRLDALLVIAFSYIPVQECTICTLWQYIRFVLEEMTASGKANESLVNKPHEWRLQEDYITRLGAWIL